MSDGSDRYDAKRAAGIPDRRPDGSRTSPVTDEQSAEAEKFAALRFGAVPNLEVYATHGDEGYDFKLGGRTVDVKWVGWENEAVYQPRYRGHLILNPYGRKPADLLVAVVGSTMRGFSLLGFATREHVQRERRNFGYGNKFALHTDYLQPFWELDACCIEPEWPF